jgi:hypothetical protein
MNVDAAVLSIIVSIVQGLLTIIRQQMFGKRLILRAPHEVICNHHHQDRQRMKEKIAAEIRSVQRRLIRFWGLAYNVVAHNV